MQVICCPDRVKYFKEGLNIIDIVAVLPFYLELILTSIEIPGLAVFRVVRLVRVFRLFKVGRRQRLQVSDRFHLLIVCMAVRAGVAREYIGVWIYHEEVSQALVHAYFLHIASNSDLLVLDVLRRERCLRRTSWRLDASYLSYLPTNADF